MLAQSASSTRVFDVQRPTLAYTDTFSGGATTAMLLSSSTSSVGRARGTAPLHAHDSSFLMFDQVPGRPPNSLASDFFGKNATTAGAGPRHGHVMGADAVSVTTRSGARGAIHLRGHPMTKQPVLSHKTARAKTHFYMMFDDALLDASSVAPLPSADPAGSSVVENHEDEHVNIQTVEEEPGDSEGRHHDVDGVKGGEAPGLSGPTPPPGRFRGALTYPFGLMKKGVGKMLQVEGQIVGAAVKSAKVIVGMVRRTIRAYRGAKKIAGTAMQYTGAKFTKLWYSMLLPIILSMLARMPSQGSYLSGSKAAKMYAHENFMGSQTRIDLSVTNSSAGMRHAKKAILLLQDVLQRTKEIKKEAEKMVIQAMYLQENPKALCNGLEEAEEASGSSNYLPIELVQEVEEDPALLKFKAGNARAPGQMFL